MMIIIVIIMKVLTPTYNYLCDLDTVFFSFQLRVMKSEYVVENVIKTRTLKVILFLALGSTNNYIIKKKTVIKDQIF